jgi:hypothetical protein
VFRVLPSDARDWGRRGGIAMPPERSCAGQSRDVAALPAAADALQGTAWATAGVGGVRGLTITSPAANATYAISARLPLEWQRIDVSARTGAGRPAALTLMVDGVALRTMAAPPYQASWPVVAGDHVARAVARDASGRTLASEEVAFRVLAEEPGAYQ